MLLFDFVFGGETNVATIADKSRLLALAVASLVSTVPEELGLDNVVPSLGKRKAVTPPSTHKRQQRKFVHEIHKELGLYYVRRAYRMKSSWFWDLHSILQPLLSKEKSGKKKHKDGNKNGLITTAIRLSAHCY